MKIEVERCWGGTFRLTTPCGHREFLTMRCPQDYWDRRYATQALNLFETVYGFKRSRIRFYHVN